MRFFKVAPAIVGIALLAAALSPRVSADDYDHMTTVTFSGPVEIPPVYITGMRVLPAGTYVFKLVNSSNDRHIVQRSTLRRTPAPLAGDDLIGIRLAGDRPDQDRLQQAVLANRGRQFVQQSLIEMAARLEAAGAQIRDRQGRPAGGRWGLGGGRRLGRRNTIGRLGLAKKMRQAAP